MISRRNTAVGVGWASVANYMSSRWNRGMRSLTPYSEMSGRAGSTCKPLKNRFATSCITIYAVSTSQLYKWTHKLIFNSVHPGSTCSLLSLSIIFLYSCTYILLFSLLPLFLSLSPWHEDTRHTHIMSSNTCLKEEWVEPTYCGLHQHKFCLFFAHKVVNRDLITSGHNKVLCWSYWSQ